MVLVCGGEPSSDEDVFSVESATVSCMDGEGSRTMIKGSDLSDKGGDGFSSEDDAMSSFENTILMSSFVKDVASTSMDRSMSSSMDIRLMLSSAANVGVFSLPSVNESSRLCGRAWYFSLLYSSATKRLADRFSEGLGSPE